MRRVYDQIARVAGTAVTVLVTGESGTGKELVARTVHDLSRRRGRPFLAVNCGAISAQLIESELFGHEKGSFTGADRQHQGFFERADGGTLFLDEIGEMPLELQVKLLRVLETGTFMRVGSTTARQADVRVIAATNRAPEQAVAAGRLREDLYYRLNVFPIDVPPLRERLDDVPLLARHFLAAVGQREGTAQALLAGGASRGCRRYPWPGNVRELRNVVQRAYVMEPRDVVTDEWLPVAGAASRDAPAAAATADAASITLAARHLAAGGRAPLHPRHAAPLQEPQGAHRGGARHQPEDALQPAQGLRPGARRRRRRRRRRRAALSLARPGRPSASSGRFQASASASPLFNSCFRAASRAPSAGRSIFADRHCGNSSVSSSCTWWRTYSPSTFTLAS